MDGFHAPDSKKTDVEEREKFVAAIQSLVFESSSREEKHIGSAAEACSALSFDQPIVKREDLVALLALFDQDVDLRLGDLPQLSTRLVSNVAALAKQSFWTTVKDSERDSKIDNRNLYSALSACLMGRITRCILEEIRKGNVNGLSKAIREESSSVYKFTCSPVAAVKGEDENKDEEDGLQLEDHLLAEEQDADDFEFMSLDTECSKESVSCELHFVSSNAGDKGEPLNGSLLVTKYLLGCAPLVEYDLFAAMQEAQWEQLHIVEQFAKVVKECWQFAQDHCLRRMSLPYLAVIHHHMMANPQGACVVLSTMASEFGNLQKLNLLMEEEEAVLDNFSSLMCTKLDGRSTREAVRFYQECLHEVVAMVITSSCHGADSDKKRSEALLVPALSCLEFYIRHGPLGTVATHLLKCGLWRDLTQLSVSVKPAHHVLLAGCCRCVPLADFTLRVPDLLSSLMAEESSALGHGVFWCFLQARQNGLPAKAVDEIREAFSAVVEQVNPGSDRPQLVVIDEIIQVLNTFLLMRQVVVESFQYELQALQRNCQQCLQVLSSVTKQDVSGAAEDSSEKDDHQRQLHSVVKERLRTIVSLLKQLLSVNSNLKLD